MADTQRYPAQVFWSDDDNGYVAIAPDLPGCSAFGDSQQEALAELQHAIAAWRESMTKAGNVVPDPSEKNLRYSGKFPLRLPKSLHAELAKQAEIDGVSLNHYLNVLISSRHQGLLARRDLVAVSQAVSESMWLTNLDFRPFVSRCVEATTTDRLLDTFVSSPAVKYHPGPSSTFSNRQRA